LANGIINALDSNHSDALCIEARKYAVDKFSQSVVANQYI